MMRRWPLRVVGEVFIHTSEIHLRVVFIVVVFTHTSETYSSSQCFARARSALCPSSEDTLDNSRPHPIQNFGGVSSFCRVLLDDCIRRSAPPLS